jgi:hypothetical protein
MTKTKRIIIALFLLSACSRSDKPSPCTDKPDPPEQPEKG